MTLNPSLLTPTSDERILQAADVAFVSHPVFGDSARIRRRALARYQFGLDLFADSLEPLRQSARRLSEDGEPLAERVFREPVVRMLMEEGFDRLEAGVLRSPDELETFLPELIRSIEVGRRHAKTVGPNSSVWIWPEAPASDPLERRLQERSAELADRGDAGLNRVDPDERMLARLDAAMDLLSAVLPGAGAGALEHIGSICVVGAESEDGTLLSASGGDLLPSTVFIAPQQMDNLWDAAGHLLHEGLHLKLFDVVRTGALVSAGDDVDVAIPWRHVRWSIPRVVFSFHVYVHMVLFKAMTEVVGQRFHDRFGPPAGNVDRGHAMSVVRPLTAGPYSSGASRAEYLGAQLEGPWAHHLTASGKALTRWLLDIMATLSPWTHLANPT